ncbi:MULTISPECIES: hypothetical protein [unclassified Saccharicrinis]|uniref:hypothetical protein n=1 Tax=unclassified Saccharicrinis TaxID=2646859 RepID=UPI003D34070D
MGKILLFGFIILELGCLTIQAQGLYPVRGTVYIRDGKASKVSLSVINGYHEKRVPVDVNGDFITYLSWNTNFHFCFSKPGYIGKKVSFSTQVPGFVDKKNIYPYEILVELFPTFPNVDTAFFKKPVAKIQYSNVKHDFDYDLDYQLVVNKRLEKIKRDYQSWQRSVATKAEPPKNVLLKEQEKTAIQYQKHVEIKQQETVSTGSSPVPSKSKKTIVKEKSPFGLPPLRESYPEGKSIEIHDLKGKVITRVIIKNGEYQKVFYQVKHNWGGLYYFVQESPSNYRSISKYNFKKATNI